MKKNRERLLEWLSHVRDKALADGDIGMHLAVEDMIRDIRERTPS